MTVTVTPNSDFDEWSLSNGTYSITDMVGGSEENVEMVINGPLDMSGASGTKLHLIEMVDGGVIATSTDLYFMSIS